MSTETEALREQFEAWARKNELEAERHKYADDQYDDHAATSAWWAWRDAYQAGHADAKAENAAAVASEKERAARVCERIADDYNRSDCLTYPELMTDAGTGANDCAAAIRAGAKEHGE